MSYVALTELTRHGTAQKVTIFMGGNHLSLQNVRVWIDPAERLVHLLDPEGQRHLATAPLESAFVEWEDTSKFHRSGHEEMEIPPL
jgi:hypothetical protein